MTKKVNLTDINYIQYGNDKGKDIVLLHGWGQNIEMMKPLGDLLADNYHITIIDLPGFGKSKEPATILDVGDYTEIVHDLLCPKRDAVLLNAGASLYIGGKAETVAEGIALAAQLIDSGKAAAVLEKFIEVSNRPEENA